MYFRAGEVKFMNVSAYGRSALGICAAVTMLSGCGGLQPPIGAPGAALQNAAKAAPESADATTKPHRIVPASSYQVLYMFGPRRNGAHPSAGLINVNGTPYGTTYWGGGSECRFGPFAGCERYLVLRRMARGLITDFGRFYNSFRAFPFTAVVP